ncbi:hypothetical protein RHMOL_Rhmol04G0335400 [Rhododendron molle]|uniref:Uncharacterized protein n=1 Tax=Rhododendron molle TaxID=49168 RepID=A0ACC0P7J5_RHOML|nr:hypothetical protein RHMOL_Rhmol04G0335400 [Rhododendron molle]
MDAQSFQRREGRRDDCHRYHHHPPTTTTPLPTSTGDHASHLHLHLQNPTPALPTAGDRQHHRLLGSPTLLPMKNKKPLIRIFDAVRAADMRFPSDPWDCVSESAKELIRGCCVETLLEDSLLSRSYKWRNGCWQSLEARAWSRRIEMHWCNDIGSGNQEISQYVASNDRISGLVEELMSSKESFVSNKGPRDVHHQH